MEIESVFILPHAYQTVQDEFDYLKYNVSPSFANKFLDEFIAKVRAIVPHFLSYPECRFLPTRNHIYRNIVMGNYLIIYKIVEKEVWVLGLFDARQNPNKLRPYRRIRK